MIVFTDRICAPAVERGRNSYVSAACRIGARGSNFALRPMMIIDLLAILPFYVYLLVPFDLRALRVLRLFRLFRLLKLLRYSPALLTLKRVVDQECRALLGALLLMMMLMLFSAGIIYFLERDGAARQIRLHSRCRLVGVGDADHHRLWRHRADHALGQGVRRRRHAVRARHVRASRSPSSPLASARNRRVTNSSSPGAWWRACRCSRRLTRPRSPKSASLLYTRLFQPGATIVPAGDPGGAMYFIGSGEATVCVRTGRTHQVAGRRFLR